MASFNNSNSFNNSEERLFTILKIIFVILIVVIFVQFWCDNSHESFINIEGEENINSLYNANNLTVGNINVGGSFNMMQSGSILMWNNPTVPNGWLICDGTNGTPDLRGRFIIGCDDNNYKLGAIGGEESHVLTNDEIPSHAHSQVVYDNRSFLWEVDLNGPSCSNVYVSPNLVYGETHDTIKVLPESYNPSNVISEIQKEISNNYLVSGEISNSISSEHDSLGNEIKVNATMPHNNMPPFYSLIFIMKK